MGKKARFLSPYTDPPPPPPTSLLLSLSLSLSLAPYRPSPASSFLPSRTAVDPTGEVTTGHRLNQSVRPLCRTFDPSFRPRLSSVAISSHLRTHPVLRTIDTFSRFCIIHIYMYTRAPLFQIHFQSFINLNDSISPSILHQLRIMSSLLVFFSFLFLSFFSIFFLLFLRR